MGGNTLILNSELGIIELRIINIHGAASGAFIAASRLAVVTNSRKPLTASTVVHTVPTVDTQVNAASATRNRGTVR